MLVQYLASRALAMRPSHEASLTEEEESDSSKLLSAFFEDDTNYRLLRGETSD
jgi:hypothetical protein